MLPPDFGFSIGAGIAGVGGCSTAAFGTTTGPSLVLSADSGTRGAGVTGCGGSRGGLVAGMVRCPWVELWANHCNKGFSKCQAPKPALTKITKAANVKATGWPFGGGGGGGVGVDSGVDNGVAERAAAAPGMSKSSGRIGIGYPAGHWIAGHTGTKPHRLCRHSKVLLTLLDRCEPSQPQLDRKG